MKIRKLKLSDVEKEGVVKNINELLPQLSNKTRHPLGAKVLKRILGNGTIYAAFDGSKVVGMASIYFMETLIKEAGIIEDVVVDTDYRGKGIGKELMLALIKEAKKYKVKFIELTSSPKRKAANLMYQKLGFQKRKTNCYRLYLDNRLFRPRREEEAKR